MAKADGIKVGVGGNLGTAALDLLDENADLYVLELSSFQLELVDSLEPAAACVLNLSADHMDRYASMLEYHAAKQRIYKKAGRLVFNRDDELTQPLLQDGQTSLSFGLDNPDINDFGLGKLKGETWLVRGHNPLIAAADVALKGAHNHANVLAAMALAESIGISEEAMKAVAGNFNGLPHRCQLVSQYNSVEWIDDSKATNVGAVVAALKGLGADKNIVLIAGGQAKGQKFDALKSLVKQHVKQLVLIGQDADKLAAVLKDSAPTLFAVSMDAAVQAAAQSSQAGDIVLLSPACASFDMFKGYEHRGNEFVRAVEALV
jgi:UDP-N-acetylmuramoylalanine--D-glutamate ligase